MTDEEKEALKNFKSEYESCDHYSSDLIIELDDAEIILNLIEKQSKEIEELKDKIKAKMEEYEDYGTSIYYGLRSNGKAFHQAVRMEVKEVLQSLLEKE